MPSIGKDLVKIRKHLGLTLQDIQFATKLPQHTLEKIENDTIFVDAEEGPIYTRNFVRSYGRVLKIDDDLLIDSLNLREAGKYNHQLFRDYPELSDNVAERTESKPQDDTDKPVSDRSREKSAEPDVRSKSVEKDNSDSLFDDPDHQTKKRKDSDTPVDDPESNPDIEPADSDAIKDKKTPDVAGSSSKTTDSATTDAGSTKSKKKGTAPDKSPKEVDWANVGQKINQEKKQLPAWLIGLIILIIILGAAGYFVFQSGLLSSDNSQQEITTPAAEPTGSSLSIELDEPQSQPLPQQLEDQAQMSSDPVAVLDDTLNIVVYAAFGNVDPVRVWSDTKPRFDPYWIEQGNAMTFDFEDTVQVRGPFDNMLIFLNGHLIENMVQNFYSEEEDFVELNRSDFTSDTKWSETIDLQVPEGLEPPQEIRSRPTF